MLSSLQQIPQATSPLTSRVIPGASSPGPLDIYTASQDPMSYVQATSPQPAGLGGLTLTRVSNLFRNLFIGETFFSVFTSLGHWNICFCFYCTHSYQTYLTIMAGWLKMAFPAQGTSSSCDTVMNRALSTLPSADGEIIDFLSCIAGGKSCYINFTWKELHHGEKKKEKCITWGEQRLTSGWGEPLLTSCNTFFFFFFLHDVAPFMCISVAWSAIHFVHEAALDPRSSVEGTSDCSCHLEQTHRLNCIISSWRTPLATGLTEK